MSPLLMLEGCSCTQKGTMTIYQLLYLFSIYIDNPSLKVFTARSTNPLEAGCAGIDVTCLIPLHHVNSLNSLLTKFFLLSETNTSGILNCANNTLCFSTVAMVVVEFIGITSIYFEWVSITTRNLCPK